MLVFRIKGHLLNSVRTFGSDTKFDPAVPLGFISIPPLWFPVESLSLSVSLDADLKHLPE